MHRVILDDSERILIESILERIAKSPEHPLKRSQRGPIVFSFNIPESIVIDRLHEKFRYQAKPGLRKLDSCL